MGGAPKTERKGKRKERKPHGKEKDMKAKRKERKRRKEKKHRILLTSKATQVLKDLLQTPPPKGSIVSQ